MLEHYNRILPSTVLQVMQKS